MSWLDRASLPALANFMRFALPKSLSSVDIVEALSVLAIVLLWNLAFESESVRQQFPFLLAAQLRFHQILSSLNPRTPRVNRVVLVEVDDNTFWYPPVSGIQPTNRRFLADLALKAAEGGAALVAIDFQLKSPFSSPGDDNVRKADNSYLLDSINKITKMKIPVVLTCGLVETDTGGWKEEPNIFDRTELRRGQA